MAPTLDTLIAERRIPSLIAIFAASGGDDAQGSQRGLEYDTMSGLFAEFVDTELVPFVEDRCGVNLTSDANARAVMGGSSGGSAAFTAAFYRPDLFRRVLTCKSNLWRTTLAKDPRDGTFADASTLCCLRYMCGRLLGRDAVQTVERT
jgi:enterochelin esterase-like enzyme